MKISFLFLLPSALLADLLIPFILAIPYKGYSHSLQVMSVLGNSKSPLHILYNFWLVILGIIIIGSSFPIYNMISRYSKAVAVFLLFIMIVYALGGCILSGIFQVGETKSLATLSERIHGYGSVLGFMLLTFAPLLCGLYLFKSRHTFFGVLACISFILAAIFFILFVMADKAEYQNTVIALEGLWQRLTLLFMYIPVAGVCLLSINYDGGYQI